MVLNERVKQIRANALAAEYIYSEKLTGIGRISLALNILSIIVPILFSAALLITKGTKSEGIVNTISILLSAVLLAIAVLALLLRLEQKKEKYLIGRRSNLYVGNESLKVLDKPDSELGWFYNYVNEMDATDRENIDKVSVGMRQRAYRSALEKLHPGRNDTVCAICNASPFVFQKGSCQVCGNTPRT